MPESGFQVEHRFVRLVTACAVLVGGIAATALVGWSYGRLILAEVSPRFLPMAPSSALLLVLLAAGMTARVQWPSNRLARHLSRVVALFVSAVALLLLAAGRGIGFGLEHLLVNIPESAGAVVVGHMSPVTAAVMLTAGLGLLVLSASSPSRTAVAVLAMSVTATSSVLLLGYAYGAPLLYGSSIIPVALPTAVSLFVAGLGLLLAAGSRAWPLRMLSGRSVRARLLRALLPAMLLLIVAEGWLVIELLPYERSNAALAVALVVLASIGVVTGTVTGIAQRTGAAIEQAHEALRASDRKYRQLFESSRDALMTLAPPDWKFTSANPATVSLFHANSEEEFLAFGPWVVSPERQPDGELSSLKAKQMIERAMEQGSHFFDWTHKRIGGESFSATVLLTRVELEGKTGLQATVRDVTEQQRIQIKLLESEARYRAVAQTASDAIICADASGNIVLWNGAAEVIFGYTSAEAIGQPLTMIMPEGFRESHRAGVNRVAVTGSSPLFGTTIQLNGLSRDGRVFPLELSLAVSTSTTGYFLTGILRDITDRKRVEEERERLVRELQAALANVKTLQGFISICSGCKKIHNDIGVWEAIETYISDHSEAQFSHGLCPACLSRLYPDFDKDSELK